jgi:aspartate aminotransferase-like enzyme
MAAPGIGIVIARRAAIETLRATRRSSYYLDLVAELDKQSQTRQPRFAQPVALHASIRAACSHLREVGIDAHMARIRRQLAAVADHLARIDIAPLIDPALTSGVVANFRLPAHIRYPEFTAAMLERGYYLLYGIPGDESHFQVSTIGDLTDEHVAGLNATLAKVLR